MNDTHQPHEPDRIPAWHRAGAFAVTALLLTAILTHLVATSLLVLEALGAAGWYAHAIRVPEVAAWIIVWSSAAGLTALTVVALRFGRWNRPWTVTLGAALVLAAMWPYLWTSG